MLEFKDLHVSYGQSEVIHGLDLTAKTGEIIAIMGRNGMGKTTLFKSLVGILKVTKGKITVDGTDVTALPSFARVKKGIAYVPQGRMIFPTLTVWENILTGLEGSPTGRLPDDIFTLFPVLHEMRARRGGNLSGGQQQQLAIARALAASPKVLLLDEPTEGIQPSIIKELAHTLLKVRDSRNLTIIVSEQVLSFTMEILDRLIVIEGGRFTRDEVKGAVDVDQVKRLLAV
ncbi:MAG TPA: urea ABC transporter ATP-binding subunit UrtE [Polyangiaceae bacterium]|jgi:urea transport system ATP-binding protein|nr:urea ABC transporter ATP-binding subunit UrtE [Polyangiaceae bacterium]